MLAEKKDSNEREFYSLYKRKICTRIPLPDTVGRRCMDVGFGWVLTCHNSGEVCLLKPLSSARIHLPSFKTFPKYKTTYTNPRSNFIKRAWLIDNPAEASNFTLLVLVNVTKLGFWRNGDKNWTRMNYHRVKSPTMACINGNIYILDLVGNLLVWDPRKTDLSNPQGRVVPVPNGPDGFGACFRDYVVGSTDGSLLLINRNNTDSEQYLVEGATHFGVKRLDLSAKTPEFIEINDIGTDAVFLGHNAAVCVDATEFPSVLKSNCIYFTDDCFSMYHWKEYCPNGGGKDMGIYNVADRSIERFEVESYGWIIPPQWIFPSF